MPGRSDKYGDDAAVGSLIDETVRQLMDRGFTRDESMKAAKRLISKARESGSLSEASQSSGRGRSGHSSSSTRRHDTMVKTRDNEHKRTDKTYGKSRGSGLDNFDTMRDALDDGNRLAKNTKSHDSRYDEPTDKYDYSFRYRAEYVSDGTSYAAYVAYSESYSSSSNDRPSGQGSRGYLEESRSERAPRDYSSRSSHRDDSRSSYRDDSRSSYRDDSRSSYRDEPRSKYQSGSRSYSTQEFRPSGGHDDDSRSKYQSGSRSYRTQEFRPSGGYHDDSRSKYQSQSKSRHQSQYKGSGVSMGVKPEANLYVILGVSASATADEIKNAHRKQCLKNHPDRGGSAAMMAQINQAYDVLKDKELRAFYDRTGTITSKGSSPDA